jgi:hypothetical protein
VQEDGDSDEGSQDDVVLVLSDGIHDPSFMLVEHVTASRFNLPPRYYIQRFAGQRVAGFEEQIYVSLKSEGFDTVEI